jgi:hypothetical protein
MNKRQLQQELGKHYKSIRKSERFWVEFIDGDTVAIQYAMSDNPTYKLCESVAKTVNKIIGNGCTLVGDYIFTH